MAQPLGGLEVINTMRLGLIARADNSGLGIQTWEFYKHMKPAKTLVVDLSDLNGNKQFPERYPDNATFASGLLNTGTIIEFLQDLDVVFVAEAPYNYYLYARAREMGIKTAVQYNYEFFDWFSFPWYPMPDMLIAPSFWHYDEVDQFCRENNILHTYLHCPVNRELLPYREKSQFKTFLHNAGRSAAYDRNGTETVIDAARFSVSDAKFLIKFQGEQGLGHQSTSTIDDYRRRAEGIPEEKLEIRVIETPDYWNNYDEGDVMLLPRRYGGNCLPLNEALSTGMPVIMPSISPNNEFLPAEWQLPAGKVGEFMPRTKIDIFGIDPVALAAKVDVLANYDDNAARMESHKADKLADKISWDMLHATYVAALEYLCR